MSRILLPFFALCAIASTTLAEDNALRFQWKEGETHAFTVRQVTTVTETTFEEGTNKLVTGSTVTKLELSRKWLVKSVDATGTATLDMSITALKQQIHRPGPVDKDGKPTVDSLVLDSSTIEGRQQLAAYLDKPVVTIRIDPMGRLLEAKATGGTAERLQAELPFRIAFPEKVPPVGTPWERPFPIKLDPPLGTGEKYEAVQTYSVKDEKAGIVTIGISTALKAMPKDSAELPPLVPLLWTGEAYFDKTAGRYAGAKLNVKNTVTNHQGEGTKFEYESEYGESVTK